MIELYKNIKELRVQNHWTQEELARRMGYTDRSMIAKIESGKVDLARSKIIEFAKVFNIPPGDLMGGEDEWAGEVKDENAPVFKVSDREPVVVSDDERGLIFKLRALDQKRRDTIMRLIDFLIKEVTDGNS